MTAKLQNAVGGLHFKKYDNYQQIKKKAIKYPEDKFYKALIF